MRIIHIHNFIPDPDPGAAAAVAGAVPVSYCRLAALDVVDLCLGKVDINRLQGESMIFKRVNIKNSKRMLQCSVPLSVRPSAQSQSPPFSGPSPTSSRSRNRSPRPQSASPSSQSVLAAM